MEKEKVGRTTRVSTMITIDFFSVLLVNREGEGKVQLIVKQYRQKMKRHENKVSKIRSYKFTTFFSTIALVLM